MGVTLIFPSSSPVTKLAVAEADRLICGPLSSKLSVEVFPFQTLKLPI